MNLTCLKINGVPTPVVSWGKTVEEFSNNTSGENIVLLIPGNPGLTEFYYRFLQTLHKNLGYTVIALGHAGHESLPPQVEGDLKKLPSLKENGDLYNLQGQINHKVAFIEKYIPKNAKLHVIGHSIGSYIVVQLLKYEAIKERIVKCYLMFPTLEQMALTPNGQFFVSVTSRIKYLMMFFAWIFTLLPEFIQLFLAYICSYFLITYDSIVSLRSFISLIQPSIIQKAIFMADDEMVKVLERDNETIAKNEGVLKLYYGANDWWAPVEHCHNLKKEFPKIDAKVCTRGFMHSFVLNSSIEVANMMSDWIRHCDSTS